MAAVEEREIQRHKRDSSRAVLLYNPIIYVGYVRQAALTFLGSHSDSSLALCPCLVSTQNPKKCYSNHHTECLRPVHGALNVDEKKLIAQFGRKL